MFGLFQKPAAKPAVRDLLFGDLPIEYWAAVKSHEQPWTLFKEAKKWLDKGDRSKAAAIFREIVSMPGLETRHYLQACHFLRNLGEKAGGTMRVYGVVAEVGMPEGCDLLAVYADHAARYYNYSGRSIIWEAADDSINATIDTILLQSIATVNSIGPWQGARPAAPPDKMARLNFLTSQGLHFGEGPQAVLFNDPLARTILYAVMDVRDALISKSAGRSA